MQQVFTIFGLIAVLNVDVTQLLKWLLSQIGINAEGWGAVIISYIAPLLTCGILYGLGLLPGVAWWSAILWAIAAVLVSNGIYKARWLGQAK